MRTTEAWPLLVLALAPSLSSCRTDHTKALGPQLICSAKDLVSVLGQPESETALTSEGIARMTMAKHQTISSGDLEQAQAWLRNGRITRLHWRERCFLWVVCREDDALIDEATQAILVFGRWTRGHGLTTVGKGPPLSFREHEFACSAPPRQ
jgi:hypothetical protein